MFPLALWFVMAQSPAAPVPAHQSPPAVPQDPPKLPFEMRELTEAESAMLPEGQGRDAVAFMCVPCHGVLPALALRKTASGWSATVEDMRLKGAQGTDQQAAAAAKYLATFFAAVDVNTATSKELVDIAGFTQDEGAAIVAYRDAGHVFKGFTDLKKMPGIDSKRLAAAKLRVVYAPK